MIKKTLWLISILGVILMLVIMPAIKKRSLEKKQDKLAILLGIDIEDYDRADFPKVYFYNALKLGMTSDDIHQIVRGYETVYHCKDIQSELYYYFSMDHEEAIRFMLFYDEEGKYYDFISEDSNSRLFGTPGYCIEGPREK